MSRAYELKDAPNTPKVETCRKCPAKIIWLYTRNQRPIPVDAETVQPGDVEFDRDRHTTHFRTCPAANQFRKRKPAATDHITPGVAQADAQSDANARTAARAQAKENEQQPELF